MPVIPAVRIGDKEVGEGHPPFIVAEMSGNHNKSLDRALEIVEAAAGAGAHAIKIQTYTADTMTLDLDEGEFSITDEKSLWKGTSLYKLYEEAHLPWEWHEEIFRRCRELGIIAFSTPFDATSLDFLEKFDPPCYKIASFENIDIPLIKKVASTGKPIIISTGMATVSELGEAVDAARGAGCDGIILLKCTSTYPATPEDTNILTIPHMKELFGCHVGISDHTAGIGVSVAGVALGAVMAEKHFTLKRSDGGVDSSFSLEPDELKSLVEESERAFGALGKIFYGATEKEKASLVFRRSIYASADIKAGDEFTAENVRPIRPGYGLAPKFYENLLGRKALSDIPKGTPMTWDLVI